MKKIILTAIAMLTIATMAFADNVVSPDTLPQAAKDFIAKNFAGATATYVEKEFMKYEVNLSNGTEIEFTSKGEWNKIDAKQAPLPATILPAPVVESITKAHPQAAIMKIEKERGNFEIKLNNNMELYVSPAGKIIGQKFDD